MKNPTISLRLGDRLQLRIAVTGSHPFFLKQTAGGSVAWTNSKAQDVLVPASELSLNGA
jgi:hypothetical protein